ncbi:uncharacterized protein LOC129890275 [Solanum dulcamara]|uniref:uncharacterized protein LOC129890275 n=1 Tax=Solanum dulcamara TaxID=45834 RepID=UPI002486A541|nr:uncharacterized protein LOC129890275 [Solanum dulcamara]
MAYMVFASSPLNAQSFIKLRTNSNYSHYSCYVPSPSRVHLSYKNISHIESSKSLFTKGDHNFSFSSPKFPRVVSTYSPSLNIIKASTKENVYQYIAYDLNKKRWIQLNEEYQSMILLIVNIPQQGNKWAKMEIEYLNDLRELYKDKKSSFGRGFEVLGFFYDMEDHHFTKSSHQWWRWGGKQIPKIASEEEEIIIGEAEIRQLANFPIFGKVKVNDNHDNNLWYFLRKSKEIDKIEHEFENFLIDGFGEPIEHFIWFTGETVVQPYWLPQPGGYPGKPGESIRVQEGEVTKVITKIRQRYSEADKKKIKKNYKAKKFIICGIGAEEYNKISAYESAKEIWDCLKNAYEGTEQVKESKASMLTTQRKATTDLVVKKTLGVLKNSSSESEESEYPEDASMLVMKDDDKLFNTFFSFMEKSDDKAEEEVILTVRRCKNMYVADLSSAQSDNLTCLRAQDESVYLWKRRLVHVSTSLLNKLIVGDLDEVADVLIIFAKMIQTKMNYKTAGISQKHPEPDDENDEADGAGDTEDSQLISRASG